MGICGAFESKFCKKFCKEKKEEHGRLVCREFGMEIERGEKETYLVEVTRKHKDYGISVEVKANSREEAKEKAWEEIEVSVYPPEDLQT